MEDLRWILLALAVLLLVGVYWFGRRRELKQKDPFSQPSIDEVPSFSASDDDDWQHGVGPVRVVSKREAPVIPRLKPELDGHITEPATQDRAQSSQSVTDSEHTPNKPDTNSSHESDQVSEQTVTHSSEEASEAETGSDSEKQAISEADVIVLYLVAHRGCFIKGEQLLGAAMASDMHFGELNIFHRMDADGNIVFSMANMLAPGNFEYEQMHEYKTRGVSLFIQLDLSADPVQALDDMLICAHNLASMLELQICDHNRQLLNETVASSLRAKARHVLELRQKSAGG